MPVGEALAAKAQFVDGAMLADRGDDVLEHALVGAVVEHVAGGERPHPVAPRERVERMEPRRLARPAAMGEREMSAVAEDLGGLGERGFGVGIGLARNQSRDQPVGPGGDVLPMEEALPFFALLAVGAGIAEGEQSRQPRPAGAVLRPDQQGGAIHQIEPAAGDEPDAGRLRRAQRLDEAADAVAVGDAERLVAEQSRRREHLVGARDPAQEAVMRRRLELDIGHPNRPWIHQLKSPVRGFSPSPWRNSQKRRPCSSSTRK